MASISPRNQKISLSIAHRPRSPPRATTPKADIPKKKMNSLYLTTYTTPTGVQERTGAGIESFSPKNSGAYGGGSSMQSSSRR